MNLPIINEHFEFDPAELKAWLDGVERISSSASLLRAIDADAVDIRLILYPVSKDGPFKLTKNPFCFTARSHYEKTPVSPQSRWQRIKEWFT